MTNLAEAKSRISDTDFSEETTALAKAQILSQAFDRDAEPGQPVAAGVLKLLG